MKKIEDDIPSASKRRAARNEAVTEEGHGNAPSTALPDGGEPSFLELAAEFRKLTKGRKHTSAEVLQGEGCKQR